MYLCNIYLKLFTRTSVSVNIILKIIACSWIY